MSGTVAQLAVTRAYALDGAVRVGVVGWMQIVLDLSIDAVLFRGVLPAVTVAGITLMVAAGALLVFDAYGDGRKLGASSQPAHASREGRLSCR